MNYILLCRNESTRITNFILAWLEWQTRMVDHTRNKLPCPSDLEKPGHTSGFGRTRGYCRLGLMDFGNFFISYVFDVEESVFHSFTYTFCSGDLENLGRLPVLQELQDTDDWVLRISVISSIPTFTKSRNLFMQFQRSYHVQVDLEKPGQLPVSEVL